MKISNILAATAAALVLAFSASAANAIVLISNPDQYFFNGQDTFLKLTNYENLIDNDHNGTISDGDLLRGIVIITSSEDVTSNPALQRVSNGSFELTGIFEAEVTGTTPLGGGTATFELIPSASFEATYGAGAMVATYNDTSPDFSSAGATVAITEASATDGSLYLVLGADGTWGTDYYWAANGAITPGVASFAASLAILENHSGIPTGNFLNVTQSPPIGFPAALGTIPNLIGLQSNTVPISVPGVPYSVRSQDPIRVFATPEPASLLAWGGLALVGGLLIRRRSKK